jgi:single-strand DNA-binding protein
MLNKVMLIGRVSNDGVSKQVGAQNVLRFSMAVNRRSGEKEETLFIDCDFWGPRGEKIAQWVVKGREVFVEGRLKTDKWEKDGVPYSKTYVVADNIEFVGKKDE